MMNTKTYLIFFGKSQSFTFHAFSEEGYIQDFNSIIRDFDLLESDFFTTDKEDNKPILAKYNFKDRKKNAYSLLKLYSVAQAYDGGRIKGSIYGVALLSEKDLKICKENIELLEAAIENFANRSLNGIKFNKSDFFNDANNIWLAVKNGKYFSTINSKGTPKILNTDPQAYCVQELNDSFKLDNKISETSRIYISTDLEHFKRVHSNDGFPFYLKENSKYVLYGEKKPDSTDKDKKTGSTVYDKTQEDLYKKKEPNINTILEKITKLISDFEKFKAESAKFNAKFNAKFKKMTIAAFCISVACLILIIIAFFLGRYTTLGDWEATFFIDKYTLSIEPKEKNPTVEVDSTIIIEATITPNNSGFDWNTKAEWSIDNDSVATLTTSSQTGKRGKKATIKGKNEGTVIITLKVDSVCKSIVKKITISKPQK